MKRALIFEISYLSIDYCAMFASQA